jgi:hypothetical protein
VRRHRTEQAHSVEQVTSRRDHGQRVLPASLPLALLLVVTPTPAVDNRAERDTAGSSADREEASDDDGRI